MNPRLLFAVGFGVLLNPLNTTMISVALARIQSNFGIDFAALSWFISIFYLVSAVGQPLMGKLADRFGRRRIFLFGLFLSSLSSILAAFAGDYGFLLVCRAAQALGTSAIFPAGMGIIRAAGAGSEAKDLSKLALFSSFSAAFGPSLGGLLLQFGDWQLIFLCNLPFILLSFLLGTAVIPPDAPQDGKTKTLDPLGIGLFSLTILSLFLLFLSFRDGFSFPLLGLSAAITAGFWFWQEKKGKEAFIDTGFLRRHPFVSLIYAKNLVANIVFYCVLFGVPSYLQRVRHLSAGITGLLMLFIAGAGFLITPLVGRAIHRHGSKPALLVGSVLIFLGTGALAFIDDSTPLPVLAVLLVLIGLGTSANGLGMQTGLYAFISRPETGMASGIFMTARFVGTILCSSLLGVLFSDGVSLGGLRELSLICGGLALGLVTGALVYPRKKTLEKNETSGF